MTAGSTESAIRYAELAMPALGERTLVAPGVYWIRMPLPFALDHINLWMIRDHFEGQEGWTLIDTGVATDATRQAWQHLCAQEMDELPVVRVLCTHFHPDHIGLAHWLCQGMDEKRWHAPLWVNYAEYAAARIWSRTGSDDAPDAANMATHFQRHGIDDPELLAQLRGRRNLYPSLVPAVPSSFRRIFPNESIRIGGHHWHVIAGYGHSPEHCSLFCEDLNLVISGDMVLPKISTNMSVWAQEPDADPLKLYLDSLHAFEHLPDDVLVLPSHGKPFGGQAGTRAGGLKVRLEQLREHHRARLSETLAACASPSTAAQVMPILFPRKLDSHQLTFALGETIAHLNHLWHAGALKRLQDGHSAIRFVTA